MVLQQQLHSIMSSAENFESCTTGETVGTAVSRLASSHDALLVLDATAPETFAGLFASHDPSGEVPQPQQAKVGNFLLIPPRLFPTDDIGEALAAMLEHRINLIPVRDASDETRLAGAATVAAIMQLVQGDQEMVKELAAAIRPNTPITAPAGSTVGQVIDLMSEHHISRVVLVSDSGALAGIVSRRDISQGLVRPNDRQRFSTRDGSPVDYSFDTEKPEVANKPISAFAQSMVTTVNDTSPLVQAVNIILNQEQSSVVIVNEMNYPTGFLSRRDILVALLDLEERPRLPVEFRHLDLRVSESEQQRLDAVAQAWATKVNRQMPLSRVTISFGVIRNPQGRVKEIETTTIVDPAGGPSSESLIGKAKTRGWLDGLQQTMRMVDTQLQRRK